VSWGPPESLRHAAARRARPFGAQTTARRPAAKALGRPSVELLRGSSEIVAGQTVWGQTAAATIAARSTQAYRCSSNHLGRETATPTIATPIQSTGEEPRFQPNREGGGAPLAGRGRSPRWGMGPRAAPSRRRKCPETESNCRHEDFQNLADRRNSAVSDHVCLPLPHRCRRSLGSSPFCRDVPRPSRARSGGPVRYSRQSRRGLPSPWPTLGGGAGGSSGPLTATDVEHHARPG
jgi:hypothetical protein